MLQNKVSLGSEVVLNEQRMRSEKVSGAVRYTPPRSLIRYEAVAVSTALTEAKSAVLSLQTIPYQRSWVEELQKVELKREVAGTSRIEGAEFTERELDAAMRETPEALHTRSQRQAHAASAAYRWIASIPLDRPIDAGLVLEIHRRLVEGADDDHCTPGALRREGENVTFGSPRHRGAEGGRECREAFERLIDCIRHEFRGHDPLIQALAAHFHLAAIHPFQDGNGRTARATEALLLQRAGLRDTCFIAMSNYYYEEKTAYLSALGAAGAPDFDLTSFLIFALRGVASQSRKMLAEIQHQVAKGLYRNLMFDLFGLLKSPKKRVIKERQLRILKLLLDVEAVSLDDLLARMAAAYESLKNPRKAVVRDLNDLISLGAIRAERRPDGVFLIRIRLEWPTQITETEFFAKIQQLPRSKTLSFLQ